MGGTVIVRMLNTAKLMYMKMDSGRIIGDILQCCQEVSLHKCLEWASLVSAGLRLACFSLVH